ncbi:MAG: isoprenylcysteine carboxylmethyltransferase family protein [Candidatus Micrarchaeota archaeon]
MGEDTAKLRTTIVSRFGLAVVGLAAILFLPAGSFDYWQAWVYCAVILIPPVFVVFYFLKNDPELLKRRMRLKEKEAEQKAIVLFTGILFFIGLLIPGLDYRFGWSMVPFWLVVFSDIMVLLGYLLVFLVFKENTYTSRIVEVEKGQKVISTGPYSIVRHPMYVGVILMFLFTPLALGSYYALVPFIFISLSIFFRIRNEEKVLSEELKGYKEYCKKVKYRLIPFVW